MNPIGRRGSLDTGRPSPGEILAAVGNTWDGDPLTIGEIARLVCHRRGHTVDRSTRVEDLRTLIPFAFLGNELARMCRTGRLVRHRVGDWQAMGFPVFLGEARTERWGYATREKLEALRAAPPADPLDRREQARQWAREEILRRSPEWLRELEDEWYAAHPETGQEK